MLPARTCTRSQCLKLQPLDYVTVSHFFPLPVTPLLVSTSHTDVIADKRKLMHVESMAASTHERGHTQTKLPPTHVSLALLCLQTQSCVYTGGMISEEYCFWAGARPWQWCMELHILPFSPTSMQLPGRRADGWAQLATWRLPSACHGHLCGHSWQHSRTGFSPHPDLAITYSTGYSQQNWPPDNNSLFRHHDQCNKTV